MKSAPLKLIFCISTLCHGAAISLLSLGGIGVPSLGLLQPPHVLTILTVSNDDPEVIIPPTPTMPEPTYRQVVASKTEALLTPVPKGETIKVIPHLRLIAPVKTPLPSEPRRTLASTASAEAPLPAVNERIQLGDEGESYGDEVIPTSASLPPDGTLNGAAEYRHVNKPEYPREARKRKQEGVVVFSVKLSSAGEPAEILLQASSGFSLLDAAARESVRTWEFVPARENGSNVETTVTIPVRFSLHD